MSDQQVLYFFPIVFPFLFVGMWLAIGTILWKLSGWQELQDAFPDIIEKTECNLRLQSGAIGASLMVYRHVAYGSCLNFGVCRSGLRVSLMWMFRGLYCKPFFVPWQRIRCDEVRLFWLLSYKRLSFVGFDRTRVFIRPRTYDKILQRSNGMMLAAKNGSIT
jgi:hypothetical protein